MNQYQKDASPWPKPVFLRKLVPVEATFITRPNRFLAIVRLSLDVEQIYGIDYAGDEITAHLPDPGRLKELLIPNARVYVLPVFPKKDPAKALTERKTFYDLVLVEHNGLLVSLDSRLPNELVYEALKVGFFPDLLGYSCITREFTFKNSRFDFHLSIRDKDKKENLLSNKGLEGFPCLGDTRDCLVEVKSVTLVEDGLAKFPDAPTIRGKRHLIELTEAVSQGYRAIVIFIIQCSDALRFTVNEKMDPEFANALVAALAAGVEVWAWRCNVALDNITLETCVPVNI